MAAMRAGELVDESGLPHAGLAHDRDELTAAGVCQGQRPAKLLDLGLTADKPGEPPTGRRVEP